LACFGSAWLILAWLIVDPGVIRPDEQHEGEAPGRIDLESGFLDRSAWRGGEFPGEGRIFLLIDLDLTFAGVAWLLLDRGIWALALPLMGLSSGLTSAIVFAGASP
jgi:hypothetical protein